MGSYHSSPGNNNEGEGSGTTRLGRKRSNSVSISGRLSSLDSSSPVLIRSPRGNLISPPTTAARRLAELNLSCRSNGKISRIGSSNSIPTTLRNLIPPLVGATKLAASAAAAVVVADEKTSLLGLSVPGLHTTKDPTTIGITTATDNDFDKLYEITSTTTTNSPPVTVWIGPALLCAICYALYNIFIKKGSASINPILGGVVLQLVAVLFGITLLLCILVYNHFMLQSSYTTTSLDDDNMMINYGSTTTDTTSFSAPNNENNDTSIIQFDKYGIYYSILAGVAVGIAEIVSFCVSGLGVQATQSIPIIIGGSVMFGTIFGTLFLNEYLSIRGWIGVLFVSIGITLVGMDSSGDGHH
jgi:bacterial/archaeal transporter family protein